ncbi:MAG: methyltransferase domain-containing protein [Kiritimatiellia bacterium]|nr:methyltransferase domain-containing protein [Kiritimatiellia bacterium]
MAKLITEHHHGADLYSDGAVEDELLALFKAGGDISAVLREDKRWPVLYHLSPERRNLLEWFPFRKEGNLLEIGAGCGALTGFFAEKVGQVTAVELSAKRSQIIYERYRKNENLKIIAGNICDFQPQADPPVAVKFEGKFDYITLIGVLEYARSFLKGDAPAGQLLELGRALLKPDGVLIVAIENKFGLKYFAGAREDHSGRSFESLEGYQADSPAETWSRDELSALLSRTGFVSQRFYYPYPDYKLPAEIFSDDYLPEINHIFQDAPNYDRDRYRIFSEKLALANLVENRKFDFFANSFLVLASVKK